MSTALKSAAQIAYDRCGTVPDPHPIPPITDPMGKHWNQPNRLEILVDATHAVMPRHIFNQLAEYSCSFPTGVYPGKMWKRHQPYERPSSCNDKSKPACEHWFLLWFGNHKDPRYVSNNSRKILVIEPEIAPQ